MKEHRKIINQKLWNFSNEIIACDVEIRMCNILINDLKNPLKATCISGMPSAHSDNSIVENAIILCDKYKKEITDAVIKKEKTLKAFNDYISPLNLRLQQIIQLRYIDCLKPLNIAYKLVYSEIRVRELIAEAQDLLWEYYK